LAALPSMPPSKPLVTPKALVTVSLAEA